METISVKDLVLSIDGKLICGDCKNLFEGISIDSRNIGRGQFFFAIKGKNFDSHDFLADVIKQGAAGAVVCDEYEGSFGDFPLIKVSDTVGALGAFAKFYRGRFKDIKIAGITGSNGKTTTKEMLFSIFTQKGKTVKNVGNFNNQIGLPLSLLEITSQDKFGVFEMGTSFFGEIKNLSDILSPDGALITNIGCAHLESFISCEGVLKEKRVLFDSVLGKGFIALNLDDDYLRADIKGFRKVISYSINNLAARVFAKNIVLKMDKTVFDLCLDGKELEVSLPAKGTMNVSNALGAAALAFGFGFNIDEIKTGLEDFKNPAMRMETFMMDRGTVLINDAYNANPSSMTESIKTICEAYKGKKINLVLGDMFELGDTSDKYHKELGGFLAGLSVSGIFLIGDKMRNVKEVLAGKKVFHTNDSQELISEIEKINFDDDTVILFKGSRGMKLDKVYGSFAATP